MTRPNPKVPAPFSDASLKKIQDFQNSGADNVYKCKDPRHTEPLEVNKLGLRCKVCRWEQKHVHMMLGEQRKKDFV